MSRLNKTQIYAIRWLYSNNKTPENIAVELNLNIDQVNRSIEKFSASDKQPNIKTQSEKATNKSESSMIRETSGKKTNSVSIMTKDASAQGDEFRKKTISKPDSSGFIYRPKK